MWGIGTVARLDGLGGKVNKNISNAWLSPKEYKPPEGKNVLAVDSIGRTCFVYLRDGIWYYADSNAVCGALNVVEKWLWGNDNPTLKDICIHTN